MSDGISPSPIDATVLCEAAAIELFIRAAKIGRFEMDWQLLCAYCPQVAGSFRELERVHGRFQCEFCKANNDAALDDYNLRYHFRISIE